MNRFTALGVALAAASEEKTVLVLTADHETGQVVRELGAVMLSGVSLVSSVSHANGAGEVRLTGGGCVLVRGIRGFRPLAVDVVFVDEDGMWVMRTAARDYGTREIHDRIRECLRSPGAEVVYS